jgi:hypothetical protein
MALARDLASIAADDCALFRWATVPMVASHFRTWESIYLNFDLDAPPRRQFPGRLSRNFCMRAYYRTHQTHATTIASQMMKAWIMTPPARHTSRETRRAWMP